MKTLEDALAHGRGVERAFCCPEHDDSNASASVNTLKGVWVCYACNANGTIEGWSPSAEDLQRMLDVKDTRQRTYPETWLALFDAHHPSPYWTERYGAKVARAHRCGTHPWTGNPTYPLRDAAGRVTGVVQRNDSDPDAGKYLYPPNTHTSRTLYAFHRAKAMSSKITVVLVEGASDVMALEEGRPEDHLVLGTYGAGLHAPQVNLLHQLNLARVVGGFDDDDSGAAAIERAKYQLSGLPLLVAPWRRFGGSDAGDLAPAARWEAIRAAHRPSQRKATA